MQVTTAEKTHDILAELKEKTLRQHQKTEDSVDLMREDFSLDEYRDLLKRFYAFYKPFEERMQKALEKNPIDFNHEERLNTPRLLEDLQNLGLSEREISEIETTDDLPALDSRERIFGSLYVIEGSTLGGQIISRHLKKKFNLDAGSGLAFFSGYGADTGKMWKAYRAAVSEFADNSANEDEIIAGATETFEKIENCLAKS